MSHEPPRDADADIPPELLQKTMSFMKPAAIMSHITSKRVFSYIDSSPELWNSLSGTDRKSIDQCKAILRERADFIRAIARESHFIKNFKTFQADMTHMSVHNGLIFCSSDDQSVRAFSLDGQLVGRFLGHTGGIWAFQAIGSLLVTGSTDKTARLWDIESQRPLDILKCHRSTVRALCCINNYIITGSRDHLVTVWMRATGSPSYTLIHILEGHLQSVRCMDVSDDFLVTGSYDSRVKLWDYKKGRFIRDLSVHKKRVFSVRMYRNYVASSGIDSEVRVVTLTGTLVASHTLHSGVIPWLDFHDTWIISSGSDGSLVKYNYITKTVEFIIQESSPIKSQKIASGLLVVGSVNRVNIYTFSTGRFIKTLLTAYMVCHVEVTDRRIIVGHSTDGEYQVSVFDYTEHAC